MLTVPHIARVLPHRSTPRPVRESPREGEVPHLTGVMSSCNGLASGHGHLPADGRKTSRYIARKPLLQADVSHGEHGALGQMGSTRRCLRPGSAQREGVGRVEAPDGGWFK